MLHKVLEDYLKDIELALEQVDVECYAEEILTLSTREAIGSFLNRHFKL